MTPIRFEALRKRPERLVAGLMTGTSVDGIDVALCRIGAGPRPRLLEVVAAATVPFVPDLQARLLQAATAADAAELSRLNRALGIACADAVADLAHRSGVRVELVGSHGQTVAHEHGLATMQIGEAAFLAERLQCPVVADFRQNDIAAGGCGAPLVPIVDLWLLARSRQAVLALNLGGISNLTALPPAATGETVIGFDCGPGNMVLDQLAARFTQGAERCDRDGRLAAAGRVDPALLAQLLADPILQGSPPRSFGREQFGTAYVDGLLAHRPPTSPQDWLDLLATATELTSQAVLAAWRAHVQPRLPRLAELVVSGGGTRNLELMRRLTVAFAPVPVHTSDEHGLPRDSKEAIAFALLASARVDGIPGNLPAVTGARGPVLLGKVTEC